MHSVVGFAYVGQPGEVDDDGDGDGDADDNACIDGDCIDDSLWALTHIQQSRNQILFVNSFTTSLVSPMRKCSR